MSEANERYPIKMSKKITLFLLVLNLVLVSIYFVFDLRYKAVKSFHGDISNFDSRSPLPEISRIKEINESVESDRTEAEINFRMKAYSIGEFDNVFQTAETNSGIRLELVKPSTLLLVVPNGREGKGIELTKIFEINKWYSISINLNKSGHLKIFLDNVAVAQDFLDTSTPIKGIAVGTGYSKSRLFDGKIENFSIKYKLYKKQKRSFLNLYYSILLCGLLLLFIMVFLKIHQLIGVPLIQLINKPINYIGNKKLERKEKIKYVVTIITLGFAAISFFFYYQGMFLGLGFPKNTFLPGPATRFGDFFGTHDIWSRMAFNGVGYGASYFPSTYLIVNIFSKFDPWLAVSLFLGIFLIFFVIYTYKNLRVSSEIETIQNTAVCTLMTYPLLFIIHTGNLEAFVFFFLCLFVYLYQQNRILLSTMPLAMAISMKLFPAVFVILFIADKKYKELFYLIGWGVVLSLIPLLIFDGGIRDGLVGYLNRLVASQKMYADLMIMGGSGNVFGHSLLNVARIIMGGAFPRMELVLKPYLVFAAVIFVGISLHIIYVEKFFWKRVALLVISMCILPYTSTDYKLLHLFIPLFLFINHEGLAEGENSRSFDLVYVLLFSLLLIPKNYFYLHGDPFCSFNNILNTAFMVMIVFLIMGSSLAKTKVSFQAT